MGIIKGMTEEQSFKVPSDEPQVQLLYSLGLSLVAT